jgi:hypothetical protein
MSENQRVIQDDVATAIFYSVRDKQAAMDETKAAMHVLRRSRGLTRKRSEWLGLSLLFVIINGLPICAYLAFGRQSAIQPSSQYRGLWDILWTMGYFLALSAFTLAMESRRRIDALFTLISHGEMDVLKDALNESK